MNPPDQPCQATPAGDLRQQIIDSRVPKNEREWWASREIEKLERELTETERLRFGADADRRQLRCDLSDAKAECEELLRVNATGAERLRFVLEENSRLRALFPAILAALRNGGCCTTDVSVEFLECVPNEVASVVARLRAEVERLTAKIGNQADRIRYLEGATNHATGTPLSQAIARAEKAEAELADWSVLNLWGGTPEFVHEFVKGQQNRIHHCQDLEAELITERARLDYLGLHMGMPQVSEALNLPFSQCFPIRDAIDRAMKNETPIP